MIRRVAVVFGKQFEEQVSHTGLNEVIKLLFHENSLDHSDIGVIRPAKELLSKVVFE